MLSTPVHVFANAMDVEGSAESRQESLLRQLVRRFMLQTPISTSQWAGKEIALMKLSQNILKSSLKPQLEGGETQVANAIKKAAAADGDLSKAVHVSEVLRSLLSTPGIFRRTSILQFLLRLSEMPDMANSALGFKAMFEANKQLHFTKTDPTSKQAPFNTITLASNLVPQAKEDVWKMYCELKSEPAKNEHLVLRDLISVLQGIDGTLVKYDYTSNSFLVSTGLRLSLSATSLVQTIGRVGKKFRDIQKYLSFIRPQCGLIAQGFKAGIELEIKDYYKVLVLFESLVAETPDPASGMTLRRALVWLHQPASRIDFLHHLINETKDSFGPNLLDQVALYKNHGSILIKDIVARLLHQMSTPFLKCISEWVFDGNLVDPYNEFFIVQSSDTYESGQDCWHKIFQISPDRIPLGLISPEAANKILVTGKTLNFTKLCSSVLPIENKQNEMEMGDAELPNGEIEKETEKIICNFASLNETLDEIYRPACARLSKMLFERFKLIEHIRVIKDLILFGRSDYTQTLLEALFEGLSKPASSIFRHNLVGILESAIRSTVGLYSSEMGDEEFCSILANVDVRLHEPSRDPNGSRQLGWDIFSLDYRVPAPPLDAVLTQEAMREYSRLSQYIWLERRLEFTIHNSVRRLKGLHQVVRLSPGQYIESIAEECFVDFKRLQLLHQEALQVVSQISNHSMSVLREAWNWVEEALGTNYESISLDRVIVLHQAFVAKLRNGFVACYNMNLRSKLIGLYSACLKVDQICQGFEVFVTRSKEMAAAHSTLQALEMATANEERREQARLQYEDMQNQQHRLLTDLRAQFQSAARQLQNEMDEFMVELHKESLGMSAESKTATTALTVFLDYNGYIQRKSGFDNAKYCSQIRPH